MVKETHESIKDEIYTTKLTSGATCIFVKKPGFKEKMAVLSYDYGSADINVLIEKKWHMFVEGSAHFLEHKIFNTTNSDVIEKFSALGAKANAYTNFFNTAYYFTCNENFNKCLEIMIDLIQNPDITKENVEREKELIAEEIKMYEDSPQWQAYFNLMKTLYFHNPIRNKIIGTEESINRITSEQLNFVFNEFYNPENLCIICTGDINMQDTLKTLEKCIKSKVHKSIKRPYYVEDTVNIRSAIAKNMVVDRTYFNIGYKDITEDDFLTKICQTKIMLELLFGESSELYLEMYNKNLVDNSFVYEYTCTNNGCFIIFKGMSNEPDAVLNHINISINDYKKIDFSTLEIRFDAIKNKVIGQLIMALNDIEFFTNLQLDLFYKKISVFQTLNGYKDVSLLDVAKRFQNFFKEDVYSLSVIRNEK